MKHVFICFTPETKAISNISLTNKHADWNNDSLTQERTLHQTPGNSIFMSLYTFLSLCTWPLILVLLRQLSEATQPRSPFKELVYCHRRIDTLVKCQMFLWSQASAQWTVDNSWQQQQQLQLLQRNTTTVTWNAEQMWGWVVEACFTCILLRTRLSLHEVQSPPNKYAVQNMKSLKLVFFAQTIREEFLSCLIPPTYAKKQTTALLLTWDP